MHDAGAMRRIERACNFDRSRQSLIERQSTLLETTLQRLAFEVLHDKERRFVLFTDVVERANVWMRTGSPRNVPVEQCHQCRNCVRGSNCQRATSALVLLIHQL